MWAMKKLMIILFLGIALSLPGCDNSSRDHVAPSRIASSVDIFCKRPSGIIRRHYEKPEKIEAVLHYVRMLDPNGPVEISDDVIWEDYYEIVVHVYDGGKSGCDIGRNAKERNGACGCRKQGKIRFPGTDVP